MSVASRKGLLAAAGPDTVVVARTASVRNAFRGTAGEGNLRTFQPELQLPMSMRISQLAFSADENYLVLSAENGGGLAVYDVEALLNGSTQTAFELSTNGQALRALIPNPTPEKGELFAVITADGNLLMANLKDRNFIAGPNGNVLKTGVSCVSWSVRGKQLVAGMGDGSAYQITPEGVGKGDIPKPPNADSGTFGKYLLSDRKYDGTNRNSFVNNMAGEQCIPFSPHPISFSKRRYPDFKFSPHYKESYHEQFHVSEDF